MVLNKSKVRIKQHERGLLFKYGDFQGVLAPGEHRLWGRLIGADRASVEVVSTLKVRLEHALLDVLLENPGLSAQVTTLDLSQSQRALVWADGRLHSILGPGKYAFWNRPQRVEIERFDIASLRFDHVLIDQVLALKGADNFLESVQVAPESAVLLYRNGVLVDRLGPGQYVLWRGAGRTTARAVDLREKTAEVSGQEIMTSDKVTLRVNLVVTYRITDPHAAVSVVADADQTLYREAQLALRAAVGGRTLDQVLADKQSVGAEVTASLALRGKEFGAEVKGVGLRDIILPGEMKAILNQVVEAEKKAQAELIRRREETASVRSQANTARLLADNPVLARIRELELLKEVLAGTTATFVLGQGDLAEQVRSLVTAKST
jgi:regulator of protease activity HflC (stomatin/prohibitin superfamily)